MAHFLLLCWLAADLPREELLGRFNPARNAGFVAVDRFYLRRETADALARMTAAARRDGVTLRLLSATRNFDAQKAIWERKWALQKGSPEQRARAILRFSSMPGTSRHHWGTDVDLNSLSPAWFKAGEGQRVAEWLRTHAAEFGFCQPYTAKGPERPRGYEEEAWHWSYRPLASIYLKQYLAQIRAADLQGFTGAETAAAVRAIDDYVAGVAPECR